MSNAPKLKPAFLITLGVIIIIAGFVYDVIFAGIPYQDPTPAMLASYNFHVQVASIIRWSGVLISATGLIIAFLKKRKQNL